MPIPKEAVPGGKGNMKIVSMKESTAFVKTIIKEFPKAKRLPLYSVWKKAEKNCYLRIFYRIHVLRHSLFSNVPTGCDAFFQYHIRQSVWTNDSCNHGLYRN
jgi:hypothetical protein